MRAFWMVIKRTFAKYGADNCSQMAAAISYYVLFSLIPLTIFLVSLFGLVVRDADIRQDVIDEIVQATPLDESDGKELVEETIQGVSRVSGALSIAGLLGMAWAASSMFGAIRKSLNVAWGGDASFPYVQQKLIDLAMVLGLGLLLGLSIAGTGALRALRELSDDALGPLSTETGFFWSVLPLFLPGVVSFIAFVMIYRYVPTAPALFRDVWPGALLSAVLFELLKNGYAIYIAKFTTYDVVYGALGGIFLFMLWTYLTASILLLGAELAVEHQKLRTGGYAEALARPGEGALVELRRFVRGLFLRET